MRRDVVAAIATVVRGVADEYAERGVGVELVVHGGCEVGEAATLEHAKLVVGRFDAEEEGERCSGAGGATWPPVNEVCRRGQCLCPERQGSCTMKKHCSNTIINSAEHSLGLAILL